MSLIQEADIQSGHAANSSVGIVLDFSQYFDRGANLGTETTGSTPNNGQGLSVKPLQIIDAFWCERKNHKKRSNLM